MNFIKKIGSFIYNSYQNISVYVEALREKPIRTITATLAVILTLWVGLGWLALEKERVVYNMTETKVTGVEIVKVTNSKGQVIEAPKNIDTYFIKTDKGAYRMEDNWFYLQFDSGDDSGVLVAGKTYDFWHLGIRVPPLSWYENVIYFEEVKDVDTAPEQQ